MSASKLLSLTSDEVAEQRDPALQEASVEPLSQDLPSDNASPATLQTLGESQKAVTA